MPVASGDHGRSQQVPYSPGMRPSPLCTPHGIATNDATAPQKKISV